MPILAMALVLTYLLSWLAVDHRAGNLFSKEEKERSNVDEQGFIGNQQRQAAQQPKKQPSKLELQLRNRHKQLLQKKLQVKKEKKEDEEDDLPLPLLLPDFERIVPGWNRTRLLNPIKLGTRLELVHIPKTGGTALEMAAAYAGVPWGMCHNQQFKLHALPYYYQNNPNAGIKNSVPHCKVNTELNFGKIPIFGRTPLWHTPPCFFFQQNQSLWYGDGAALFAVVRHPYDKWISEYGYIHRKEILKHQHGGLLSQHRHLNEWLAWVLSKLKASKMGASRQRNQECRAGQMISRYWTFLGGHVIPQFDFVYGPAGGGKQLKSKTTTRSRLLPYIHHVLHYEHLQQDLATLLAVYQPTYNNLSLLPLPDHRPTRAKQKQQQTHNSSNNNSIVCKPAVDARHLDRSNLDLINDLYRDDFDAFGYTML